jgi:hypothetical protein
MRTETIQRPETIEFVYLDEDGVERTQLVPPVTVGRFRRAVEAQPSAAQVEGETLVEALIRTADFIMRLLPARLREWVEELTLDQAVTLRDALILQHAGRDARSGLITLEALRQALRGHPEMSRERLMRALDSLSIGLCVYLQQTPAMVEALRLGDAVAISTQMSERRRAEMEFLATMHGCKVTFGP